MCDHEPKAATDRAGNRLCLDCATAMELEAFSNATDYSGYIGSDERFVTTWTGSPLVSITELWGSKRAKKRFFRGFDKQGNLWYGSGPNESGTYVNMHRNKV